MIKPKVQPYQRGCACGAAHKNCIRSLPRAA
jgi:hypothetical protein